MKVTRIAFSHNLNPSKFDRLREIARRLGDLRREIWHRYGSISGLDLNHRQIRDRWLAQGRQFDLPARLWKETLRDTLDDIKAYREAAKEKVRKKIHKKTKDERERKRLYTLLKSNRWMEDNWLRCQMRKHYKHGKTGVDYQIILDNQCYKAFLHNGRGWIEVMSLEPRKRIAIPLNTTHLPSGTLRLIIQDDSAKVHYTIEADLACSTRECGERKVGIDKGYSEVCTDSDGVTYGSGLGELLSAQSDYLKSKYQRRNKLYSIAEKKPHKAKKIIENNIGQKKLDNCKQKHIQRVRDKVFKAVHELVDKAGEIVCEDLSFTPKSKKPYSKNQKRRLAGWVKGMIKEALENVSERRGSTLVYVNAAYTSQMDSRYGILLGERNGKKFNCYDGVVMDADVNAARNVLARREDNEIGLYMPYQEVKGKLLKRTERYKSRLGLLNQDTSCSGKAVGSEQY